MLSQSKLLTKLHAACVVRRGIDGIEIERGLAGEFKAGISDVCKPKEGEKLQ